MFARLIVAMALVAGCAARSPAAPTPAPAPGRATAAAPAPSPAPAPLAPEPEEVDRPTSKPFAGDPAVYEHPARVERLQIERVMELLRIVPGATVADIGAGGGWFSVRAARRVGPGGLVYAVEINPRFVEHIAARARKEGLSNVRAIEGETADPKLPERSLDAVLLLKTYHELAEPIGMLRALHRAMRPGARLGIIDRNGRGNDHGVDADVVRSEAERAGFSFVERHDWHSRQERVDYFLIFAR